MGKSEHSYKFELKIKKLILIVSAEVTARCRNIQLMVGILLILSC